MTKGIKTDPEQQQNNNMAGLTYFTSLRCSTVMIGLLLAEICANFYDKLVGFNGPFLTDFLAENGCERIK